MGKQHGVAFLGFSEFERSALASYFRLAANRTPSYRQLPMLADADILAADFLVADADHAPSVQLVVVTERMASTVFIGTQPPAGSTVWMPRPIDALHVMRELDAMVALADGGLPASTPMAAPAPAQKPADGSALSDDAPALLADIALPDVVFLDPSAILLEPAYGRFVPPPQPAPAPPPGTPPPPGPPASPSARALLVDDSAIALRYLESRLQHFGLQTDCACDSSAATDLLLRHSYDLVFIDVELGDGSALDGLELCQHVKQSAAAVNATVVLVSAHHSELDRVRGALAGCDAYLGKPLHDDDLERLLVRQGLAAGARRKREKAPPS